MRPIVVFLCVGLLFHSCHSQNKISTIDACQSIDESLSILHNKMYETRHDDIAAKDGAIQNFRTGLLSQLSSIESNGCYLDSLDERISIVGKPNDELRIFSWDEFNSGTWHNYHSAYQYKSNDQVNVGTLVIEDTENEMSFTDVIYFSKDEIASNQFLVQGYGTHGHGHDFFTMRLLSFKAEKLEDCHQCFDGEDRLTLYKARADKFTIDFDSVTKSISFPILKEDQEVGFMRATGAQKTLHWSGEKFMP